MDVQLQVERSLGALRRGPARTHPQGANTPCVIWPWPAKGPARTGRPHDNGFVVTVRLNKERAQKVFIMPHDTRDGQRLVRIYTPCGEPSAEALSWALRANGKLITARLRHYYGGSVVHDAEHAHRLGFRRLENRWHAP